MGALAHTLVHMDHHGAARRRPMARYLFRTVQGGMHQQDDADGHAQFPFDMRPRISSWRQLMYRSDHLHHSCGSSCMLAA